MQATRARDLTPAQTAHASAPHLTVVGCTGLCDDGAQPCTCPCGAAEAATNIGFEHEPKPRRIARRMSWLQAVQAWHLRWLLRTLIAEHERIDSSLTATTNVVVEMARRGQRCPWWPARRRELQERRALLEDRITEVTGDLAELGAAK